MTNYKKEVSCLNHAKTAFENLKKPVPVDIYLPKKWINLLFMRMEGIFGPSWSQRHTEPETWSIAKEEWSKSLGKYANDLQIIAKAIDLMINDNRSYPPSLPEFLRYCEQCEPIKISGGFHEASEEFKKRYQEWDKKPALFVKKENK